MLDQKLHLKLVVSRHVHEDSKPALQPFAFRGTRSSELRGVWVLISKRVWRKARQELEVITEDGAQGYHLLHLQSHTEILVIAPTSSL